MRYAVNRNRGSSLLSASRATLGVSCPPSGASVLHTLSSGPLPLHWNPRLRGLINVQDQLIADFSLCPRSLGPLGDPRICRCRGIQKAVHEQWKSIKRPSLGCKQTAPRPGRTKQGQCGELVLLLVLEVV